MGRRFASAYERIAWAEQHIQELKDACSQFFNSPDAYRRVSERNPKSLYYIDKIKLTRPLPSAITRLTVQSIESLRSALDHAACAVVATAAQRKRTSFPFGDTKRDFQSALREKCKHVPDEIRTLFGSFNPYKRGNPALWTLNRLCNIHKHRTIVQPGIIVKDVNFSSLIFISSVTKPGTWVREKNEIIISKASEKRTVHHDVDFFVSVAFGKVNFLAQKPVLPGLRYFASIVKSIVLATEAEARRIGVIR